MRRFLKRLAALAALALITGLLVAWAGLVPIAASSGHWPVTAWLLHFTMRQSVQTSALGLEAPPLDEPARILRGAGHYDSGCAPCHGAPGSTRSPIVQHMTPQPPYLPPRIEHWEPEELFWIVKHGVKFTGMPAWPARHRDDEVWSVVAFLRRLPELEPQEYRELTGGDRPHAPADLEQLSGPARQTLERCADCHGKQGNGRGVGAFPRLAGQSRTYLFQALQAYASGERPSGIMQPMAVGLSERTMRELARHYASAPPAAGTQPAESELVRLGAQLARRGNGDRRIPACTHCHGPKQGPRNPAYPLLAGQYFDYLLNQLELWRQGHRGGSEYARLMHSAARRLEGREIRALAAYYASLPPETAAE